MMRQLLICLVLLTLVGCAGTGSHIQESASVVPAAETVDMRDSDRVRQLLEHQYAEWQGTPHRLGGNSRRGVDCSGFVQQTFASRFGLELPRSTNSQATLGATVSRDQLQPGDLVFFKTGFKKRHVGIYKGDTQFLHASSSQGVSVSSLNNQYWASNYWQSRRVGVD